MRNAFLKTSWQKRLSLCGLFLISGLTLTHGEVTLKDLKIGSKLPDSQGVNYTWKTYTLNLRVIENNFYLFFLDKEQKIVTPPVKQASVRFQTTKRVTRQIDEDTVSRKREEIFIALEPNTNAAGLYSPRYIAPPTLYWVMLSLLENKDTILQSFDRAMLNQIEPKKALDRNTEKTQNKMNSSRKKQEYQ